VSKFITAGGEAVGGGSCKWGICLPVWVLESVVPQRSRRRAAENAEVEIKRYRGRRYDFCAQNKTSRTQFESQDVC
jgi:hypothetical protein